MAKYPDLTCLHARRGCCTDEMNVIAPSERVLDLLPSNVANDFLVENVIPRVKNEPNTAQIPSRSSQGEKPRRRVGKLPFPCSVPEGAKDWTHAMPSRTSRELPLLKGEDLVGPISTTRLEGGWMGSSLKTCLCVGPQVGRRRRRYRALALGVRLHSFLPFRERVGRHEHAPL